MNSTLQLGEAGFGTYHKRHLRSLILGCYPQDTESDDDALQPENSGRMPLKEGHDIMSVADEHADSAEADDQAHRVTFLLPTT